MYLYFVRHGETQWNRMEKIQGQVEIPLNDYGVELAYATQEGLKDVTFDAAFSSPLSRAYDTCRIILGNQQVEITKDERLLEIGFGVREGSSILDIQRNPEDAVYNFFEHPSGYCPPETAESFEHLFARSRSFMEEVIFPLEGNMDNILIASHSAVIRSILNPIAGLKLEEFWKIDLPNCAVSIIELKNGKLSAIEKSKHFY